MFEIGRRASARDGEHNTTTALTDSIRRCKREVGCVGSNGTKAPPAFMTPSIATMFHFLQLSAPEPSHHQSHTGGPHKVPCYTSARNCIVPLETMAKQTKRTGQYLPISQSKAQLALPGRRPAIADDTRASKLTHQAPRTSNFHPTRSQPRGQGR